MTLPKHTPQFTNGSYERIMRKFVELNGLIGKSVAYHKIKQEDDDGSVLYQFTEFYPNGNRMDALYRVIITNSGIAVIGENEKDCLEEVLLRNGINKKDASRIFSKLVRVKERRTY